MTKGSPSVVRGSVVGYLALSSVVLAIVACVCVVFASRLAVDQGLHHAEVHTRAIADELASPFVNDAVRQGDHEAVVRLAGVMENRMLDGSLTHAAVYSEEGVLLWSDRTSTQHGSSALEEDVAALLGTRDTVVVKPGEGASKSGSEQETEGLIRVYAGAQGVDGTPFVFAASMTTDAIEESRSAISRSLLPVVLGMMLLFLFATLPLVIGLARRVDRAARSQSELLRRSVGALQDERRRVAQVLHDGVIQDLSAIGYLVTTLAARASEGKAHSEQTREAAERISALIQDDLRQLRSVVGGLFPTELEGGDLVAALDALRARSSERFGLAVSLDVQEIDGLDERTSDAVYRVVREALANVANHAHASTVVVRIRRADANEQIVITVSDDGVGLSGSESLGDPEIPDGDLAREHLGLRFLSRHLDELGGALRLMDGPAGGAVLTARIPILTVG